MILPRAFSSFLVVDTRPTVINNFLPYTKEISSGFEQIDFYLETIYIFLIIII